MEKNLIIVTEVGSRGTASDLGTVLWATKKIQQKPEVKTAKEERRLTELTEDIEKIKSILSNIIDGPTS